MTIMIHSKGFPSTNAATKTMPIEARKIMVATTRTGLNMSFNCWKKPIRNPVPIKETIMPRVYMMTKDTNIPKKRMDVANIETTKPIARHAPNPYSRCVLVSFKNAKALSPSNIWV